MDRWIDGWNEDARAHAGTNGEEGKMNEHDLTLTEFPMLTRLAFTRSRSRWLVALALWLCCYSISLQYFPRRQSSHSHSSSRSRSLSLSRSRSLSLSSLLLLRPLCTPSHYLISPSLS